MIKQVGATVIREKHRASCHCGAVVLELTLPDGIENPSRCDCSICRRRGVIASWVPLDRLKVVKGHNVLRLYQFNTRTAKHYFCSTCGIYTHHRCRLNPELYAYNIACLDGVNPFELGAVPILDGINHPSDKIGEHSSH
jgi:hypothetical protein